MQVHLNMLLGQGDSVVFPQVKRVATIVTLASRSSHPRDALSHSFTLSLSPTHLATGITVKPDNTMTLQIASSASLLYSNKGLLLASSSLVPACLLVSPLTTHLLHSATMNTYAVALFLAVAVASAHACK